MLRKVGIVVEKDFNCIWYEAGGYQDGAAG